MTCDVACHLIDDYLDDQLSQRERQRLERHIADCPRCAGELRGRLTLDRSLRHALTASVQHLQLASAPSRAIIQTIEGGVRQPLWPGRLLQSVPMMAGAFAVLLLLVGLFLLLGRIPVPGETQPSVVLPAGHPALSVNRDRVSIEPRAMVPGDPFTITVPVDSNWPLPIDTTRCDLDISGPTGRYRFALVMQGPLPSRGTSILRVTPAILDAPCQEQYQIAPTDIFSAPGVYTFRITVFSPALTPSE